VYTEIFAVIAGGSAADDFDLDPTPGFSRSPDTMVMSKFHFEASNYEFFMGATSDEYRPAASPRRRGRFRTTASRCTCLGEVESEDLVGVPSVGGLSGVFGAVACNSGNNAGELWQRRRGGGRFCRWWPDVGLERRWPTSSLLPPPPLLLPSAPFLYPSSSSSFGPLLFFFPLFLCYLVLLTS
jgi:hypothetical protein